MFPVRYGLPTVYLCVPYGSHSKQALTGWALWRKCDVLGLVLIGSYTSTVDLKVVGGDDTGTQCPGVYPGYPVPGRYKYGGLPLQVG
jgi:hypothetical protein